LASLIDYERRVLFDSFGIGVVDFRCRAPKTPEGGEEPNPTHSIVLVRRGVFRRVRQSETVLADPNHVLFFNAREPYRYAHPLPGGDDCTILAMNARRVLDLVSHHAPWETAEPAAPFRRGHALASPVLGRLHHELLALLHRREPAVVVEDVLAELADEAVRIAYAETGRRRAARAVSTRAERGRRELVEATKLAVNQELTSPPGLGVLARLGGCSTFHLSRVFRDTAGISLRRYVQRLRARVAAERLAAGARDLSRLALDLGYFDHSHFTNAFRREWGVPPSRFRAANLRPARVAGSPGNR
jgi:AraC family transcriptional regulator